MKQAMVMWALMSLVLGIVGCASPDAQDTSSPPSMLDTNAAPGDITTGHGASDLVLLEEGEHTPEAPQRGNNTPMNSSTALKASYDKFSRSLNPDNFSNREIRALMDHIEKLGAQSEGNWSCSFEFKHFKKGAALTLKTYNNQRQTLRLPAGYRVWTEEGVGGFDLHIQGAKFFTCGAYRSAAANELVERLMQINVLLDGKNKKRPPQ